MIVSLYTVPPCSHAMIACEGMDHMMKLKLDSAIHNGLTLHHSQLSGLSDGLQKICQQQDQSHFVYFRYITQISYQFVTYLYILHILYIEIGCLEKTCMYFQAYKNVKLF